MKIDDRKWAPIFTSVLVFAAAIGLAIAVVGGTVGAEASLEVGSLVFAVSLLCLRVVAEPKPHDRGEEEQTDDDQAPAPLTKKQRKQRKQREQREQREQRK